MSDLVSLKARRLRGVAVEREAAGEPHLDYVLEPYEPRAPAAGKLRSVSVLYASFALAGKESEGRAVVERLRRELGPGRTVWGVKLRPDRSLGWELYFYDRERRHADLSLPTLARALAPEVRLHAREPFPLGWHMVSVELGALAGEQMPADVYVDMRSYTLRGDAMELANAYTFHDPRSEIEHFVRRARSSVHFDFRADSLARLLSPGMFRCHRLCFANKRRADAVYAARVGTPELEAFLARHRWPAELTAWVAERRSELDHLCWDVGLDFAREAGALAVGKTGFYGYF